MSTPATPIKLIIGLGNPGPEYEQTRHNAGAWFVNALAQTLQLTLRTETKFKGCLATTQIAGQRCNLLIPNTFMNHSGQAVKAVCQFYKIQPEAILVAHDELDFDPGQIRFKQGGGHGGHNGLRDIINHLHSNNFNRLRIGIGHPKQQPLVHDYVLSKPSKHDQQRILDSIADGMRVIDEVVSGNLQKVMKDIHTQ